MMYGTLTHIWFCDQHDLWRTLVSAAQPDLGLMKISLATPRAQGMASASGFVREIASVNLVRV